MTRAILMALAPVFFVMAVGYYAAGRFRIVDNHNVDGPNALVMDFALPASLLAATAAASRSQMLGQAPLFAILGAVMLVLFVARYVFARTVWKVGKADASVQALTIAFPNLAGVGLPIAAAALGPTGTVPLRPVGRALTEPVVLAPGLGILLSVSDVGLGSVAEACLLLSGHAAAGVALFLTGLVLSVQAFELDWMVVAVTWVADIIRPLLAAAVVWPLPVSAEIARTAILIAAVPSSFFGILFAVSYRLDSATAGSMVIASTLPSIATMAVTIAMLFPH